MVTVMVMVMVMVTVTVTLPATETVTDTVTVMGSLGLGLSGSATCNIGDNRTTYDNICTKRQQEVAGSVSKFSRVRLDRKISRAS